MGMGIHLASVVSVLFGCAAEEPRPVDTALGTSSSTASTVPSETTVDSPTTPSLPTGDTAPDPCAMPQPDVELGVGSKVFAPAADADAIVMEHGPQGGWHLTTAVRLAAVSELIGFHPTATVVGDGRQIGGHQPEQYHQIIPYDSAQCTGDVTNLRVYLDVDMEDVCGLAGLAAEVVVDVRDLETGEEGSDSRTFILQLDPMDEPLCL